MCIRDRQGLVQRRAALEVVPELADVPRPGRELEAGEEGRIGESTPGLLVEGEPPQELAGDERDVAGPLPERRQAHGEHGEPEVEVGPEPADVDLRPELAICLLYTSDAADERS